MIHYVVEDTFEECDKKSKNNRVMYKYITLLFC